MSPVEMDVEKVRACFPALGSNENFSKCPPVHPTCGCCEEPALTSACGANNAVFADNAGGSQVLEGVVSKLSDYMLGSNVQMGRWPRLCAEDVPPLLPDRTLLHSGLSVCETGRDTRGQWDGGGGTVCRDKIREHHVWRVSDG